MNAWLAFPVAAFVGMAFGILGGRSLDATVARITGGGGRGSAVWGLFRRAVLLVLALAVGSLLGLAGCLGAGTGYTAGFVLAVMRAVRANGV